MDGIITVFLVADPGTAQPGIVGLLLDADLLVQLVLLTLLGMSVVCWYIIFMRVLPNLLAGTSVYKLSR